MRKYSVISVLCLAVGAFLNKCQAEPLKQTQSVSGGVGLIENPTARMALDGEWGVHLSHVYPYNRYVVFGQPLPWLEVLFKYTDIENRTYGGTLSQGYKDKSVDIKVRLREEDYYWPEVSVGIRDVGGTGLFSAEYLVANKQWGRWDFSLGLGWGYMASRGDFPNPLAELFDTYKSRETDTGKGGTIDPTIFFAGERMSLFAGVSYHMADWPVVLKLEYDANDYQNEPKGNVFEQASPINIGMVYSLADGFDLHLGYARGNEVMLGVTLRSNVSESNKPKVLDPKPEAVDWQRSQTSKVKSWPALSQDVCDQSGFCSEAIYLDDKAITLVGNQTTYIAKAKGIGRASRVLTNQLEPSVETFNFIERNNGLDVNTVSIDRDTFHRAASLEVDADDVLSSTRFNELDQKPEDNKVYEKPLKAARYDVTPAFSGSYGGPEGFLLYQLSLLGTASYYITDKTWLSGAIDVGLIDNYDLFMYSSASKLPHVRTDIQRYLSNTVRLDHLQMTTVGQPYNDWFLMGYAGNLESMFGGVGAEVLYRPYGEKWALGLDVNHVKQREFDQCFGFLDYEVNTGHLTAYYTMQDNLEFKLSAGQYLAKDRGVTIDINRRFKSGARMGVWATKTNVSAEEFGEGSFDKGFYFSLPLDLFWFKSSTIVPSMTWRFLTRDGGQKLNRQYSLYDLTQDRNVEWIKRSFDKVLE